MFWIPRPEDDLSEVVETSLDGGSVGESRGRFAERR